MAILWFLLGLLGLLLLLLCLPVGVRLSYRDKPDAPQPQAPLLTAPPTQDPQLQEVLAFLEEQGLYPVRAPFPPPKEKELQVRVRVVGIPFTLYPRKKKRARAKPPSAGGRAALGQKADLPPKLSPQQLRETLKMARTALDRGRGPLRLALRGVCIRSLQLDARISREDSCQTALWYGGLEGGVCSLLALLGSSSRLGRFVRKGNAQVRLAPDFSGQPEEITGTLNLWVTPAPLLAAGVWLGGAVVWELVRNRRKDCPQQATHRSEQTPPQPTPKSPAAQTERTDQPL